MAALLGLAAPVAAEDAECLGAPTRDCVLDRAVALAESSENRFRAAQGLLTVAVLREALVLAGAHEAGTRFVAMVLADNPDLAVAVAQFGMPPGTRGFAAADRLAGIVADPGFDAELRQRKIEGLIRLQDLPQALTLTDAIEDEADRMSSLADLALRMTWEGGFAAAEELAARTELQRAAEADGSIAFVLAAVHANLGDGSKAGDLAGKAGSGTPGLPGDAPGAEARRIRAIAALVSGDQARFPTPVREGETDAARGPVWWSLRAALTAGQRDIDPVLSALPTGLQHTAPGMVAIRQAEAGELEAALATPDRWQVLIGPHPHVESDPRFAIAPLLARRGRNAEALAMALVLGDAALVASLAVEIPE